MSDDDTWRATFDVQGAPHVSVLDRLVHHDAQSPITEAAQEISHDVVVTHDGARIFAYAATRDALDPARRTIERRLTNEGLSAKATVGCWDPPEDCWRQVDPPLPDSENQRLDQIDHTGSEQDSRTFVAGVGELIRPEFEQTMLNAAARLGIECNIVEHHHLLRSQVAFQVSGPRYNLDEFDRELKAAAGTTGRCEGVLLATPL